MQAKPSLEKVEAKQWKPGKLLERRNTLEPAKLKVNRAINLSINRSINLIFLDHKSKT